jgi:quinol-cytochrome oxidoreductase complex cytochrome b subunit
VVVFDTLLLHFRPIRVPAATIRYSHTFGLGGSCLVLFSLLALTGILMIFVYVPAPERAYESVLRLEDEVLFGSLVRSVHHWSANLLVVVALLHLLRVFFTGGFLGPRQFNWVVGLVLLFGILAANFSGYLLPWDQLSYWAVTICTGMVEYVPLLGGIIQTVIRGGDEIGANTLTIFYALHTTLIPVGLIAFMAMHFWRVRKARGVVSPRRDGEASRGRQEMVLFLPHLFVREVAVALVIIALVLVLSTFSSAPLGDPANPGMSPNPAKAPWYFLGFQELLIHFHPLFAVFVIPLIAALALLSIPYLRYDSDDAGVWFRSARGRRLAAIAAISAAMITPAWILFDDLFFDPVGWLPGWPSAVSGGLVPFLLLGAVIGTFTTVLRHRFRPTRSEIVLALFVFCAVAFAVLTATGIWFRGAGMALEWPWRIT